MNLLRYLLIDCCGLEELMELLHKSDHFFEDAVKGLSALCRHFVCLVNSSPSKINSNLENNVVPVEDMNIECKYIADRHCYDVYFVVNDKSEIGARKSQLSENSVYFSTMFEGPFIESIRTSIPLPDISATALNVVLHHLYGCENTCLMLNSLMTEVLLELITVADKLLLSDLQDHIMKEVISKLSPTVVCEVYSYAKKYDCTELYDACLRYLLVGDMKTEERCCSISAIFCTVDNAINDVKCFIRSSFPESREYPMYKRRRIDSN